MVARGASKYEVAEALGISTAMAGQDINACLAIWHENYFEQAERWRPVLVSRYELLFKEAISAWDKEKMRPRPNVKYLDSANRILGDLAKMLGLAIDVNLNQTNVTIGAADTAAALAPLDAEAYAEMLQSGTLAGLNAVAPITAATPNQAPLAAFVEAEAALS